MMTAPHSAARKIAIWGALVVFIGLVAPFPLIGEYWGMVWFIATAPFSMFLEEAVGIGSGSFFLIGLASAAAAAMWALVIYGCVRLVYFLKQGAND